MSWLLPSRRYRFRCLGCRAVLRLSPPFFIQPPFLLPCHFHRCHPFIAVQQAIITAFHSRLDLSFVELLFLLWSCRRHIHYCCKRRFRCDYMSPPRYFFAFLVVVLLVIFMPPSCCSYCHRSDGSNSHTVVLSKPCIVLSSIVLYPRKKTQTCLAIFYGCIRYWKSTAVVRCSPLKEVRLKYGGSTR